MRTPASRHRISGCSARPSLTALIALGLILGLSAPQAIASSVVPPEFDALVSQADYVIHGVVQSVTSEWVTINGSRTIISKVTVSIKEVVAGTVPTGSTVVLQMLGGQVGEKALVVTGAPKFSVGDEDILFVQGNGSQVTPLVAMTYGRYPVVHTVSGDYIARSNGVALTDVKNVSAPLEESTVKAVAGTPNEKIEAISQNAVTGTPLTKTEFITRIRAAHEAAKVSATKTP